MKKLILLFALWCIACSQPSVDICEQIPGFTTYSVAKGFHDFLPNDQPISISTPNVSFELILDESMWWEFDGNTDYFDISKFVGITDASNANNKNSTILGWRPYKNERNHFELFAFVNNENAEFSFSKIGTFKSGEVLTGTIQWVRDSAYFKIKDGESKLHFKTLYADSKDITTFRGIGGWFGGNLTAPQNMCYWMYANYFSNE